MSKAGICADVLKFLSSDEDLGFGIKVLKKTDLQNIFWIKVLWS